MRCMLNELLRDGKLAEGGTAWLKMDGCAKQYKCARAMYFMCQIARDLGITLDQMNEEHKTDFRDFGISFDNYSSTHSEYNRKLVEQIYEQLDRNGYIERRDIQQLYDEEEGMFLPDRFIRGTCPKCGTEDQYGDSCESCGSTYAPTDLIDPRSAVTGSRPVMKK